MTDPAGITQRGAERSAPRFRWAPSASDPYRVACASTCLVAAGAAQKPAIVLHSDPPDSGREVERRAAIVERRTLHVLPARSRRTVERSMKAGWRLGMTASEVGRMAAELGSQRRRAPTCSVARLTSARGGCHASQERVVVASVARRAPIHTGKSRRFAIQDVALALEGDVQ